MDVHDKLDELTAVVEGARSMPMSASCVVNRGEVLALLEELRGLLPEEFRHAQMLLADRESVVDEGRREAARLLVRAEEERLSLTSQTEVVREARVEADLYFLYLQAVDSAGHATKFLPTEPKYLAAIALNDQLLGDTLDAIGRPAAAKQPRVDA